MMGKTRKNTTKPQIRARKAAQGLTCDCQEGMMGHAALMQTEAFFT